MGRSCKYDIKFKKIVFYLFLVVFMSFLSGCAALQEGVASSMEVPTLEKQVNRVSIGMSIIRQNDLMLSGISISSDASWPKKISRDLDIKTKNKLTKLLMSDPYYATVRYTDMVQREMLGFGTLLHDQGDAAKFAVLIFNETIPPLAYSAAHKLETLYGQNAKNWPKIFESDNSLKNFLEFKSGKLLDIEAIEGDVYENIADAIVSLAPVNFQKDLELAFDEMKYAYSKVLDLKAEEGELRSELETGIGKKNLSYVQRKSIEERLQIIKVELTNAEANADEKESIYFVLLEQAVIALQSDINLNDQNYINLAKNINLVAKEVEKNSLDTYASFTIALTNIQVNNLLHNFPKELKSLARAKAYVPASLQKKYYARVSRLIKNSVYFIPNILMGTYYARKQDILAKKYKNYTDIILEAYTIKNEN